MSDRYELIRWGAYDRGYSQRLEMASEAHRIGAGSYGSMQSELIILRRLGVGDYVRMRAYVATSA